MIRSFKRRATWFIQFLTMAKKLLIPLVLGIMLFVGISTSTISAKADGVAEMIMEISTYTVLSNKNANERLPMASTTKIMTALLIIEDCNLNEVITVPDEAVGVEGSSIYLKRGEIISIMDLVYGLMLRSGNDSAIALAIHHSGSVQSFVDSMNEKAREMGAKNTKFKNPSGLPDDEHYTTASDLCMIACNAMKNETFKKVVGTRSYHGQYRSFVNKNKILTRIEGANGIKTGYTLKAGRCLVASAERDGMAVICVVLNCPDMYERSEELIEKAFSDFAVKEIPQDAVFMCGVVPCRLSGNYRLLINKTEEVRVEIVPFEAHKRINKGDLAGEILIYSQNNLIFRQNLYSIISR